MFDNENKPKPSLIICSECEGVMRYRGAGIYVCEHCGHEEMDDYGKVRAFLEKRGPSNAFEISEGTGLSRTTVINLLKDGRLEVAKSSTVGLVCARCGMAIRTGEYCLKCENEVRQEMDARNQKRGIYNALLQETDNKMRFLDNGKK
ncbi:MAG: hypothetical protein VZQ83_04105 [Eubacterium sp.]|nr:hypothetical protein [Eubacterium sp.]